MGDSSDPKQIKAELEKDTRDIAALWSDALRNYKGIAGVSLQPEFKSVDDMIKFGTEQMNGFHKFRHDQKKVDKLRGLFMANLDYIETGAQQLIAAATPAFPPAAAIGTALTYLLKVRVKACLCSTVLIIETGMQASFCRLRRGDCFRKSPVSTTGPMTAMATRSSGHGTCYRELSLLISVV